MSVSASCAGAAQQREVLGEHEHRADRGRRRAPPPASHDGERAAAGERRRASAGRSRSLDGERAAPHAIDQPTCATRGASRCAATPRARSRRTRPATGCRASSRRRTRRRRLLEDEDRVATSAHTIEPARRATTTRARGATPSRAKDDEHDRRNSSRSQTSVGERRSRPPRRCPRWRRCTGSKHRARGDRGERQAGEHAVDREPRRERANAVAQQERQRDVEQRVHAEVERVGDVRVRRDLDVVEPQRPARSPTVQNVRPSAISAQAARLRLTAIARAAISERRRRPRSRADSSASVTASRPRPDRASNTTCAASTANRAAKAKRRDHPSMNRPIAALRLIACEPMATGAQVIVEELERGRSGGLLRAARGAQPRAVGGAARRPRSGSSGVRHEQAAAYAADGYARATGRLGVALTTTGPGAANTLGAVGEAWASRSPILVIATDIPSALRRPGEYRGVLHETDGQAAMFAPVVKSVHLGADGRRGRAGAAAAAVGVRGRCADAAGRTWRSRPTCWPPRSSAGRARDAAHARRAARRRDLAAAVARLDARRAAAAVGRRRRARRGRRGRGARRAARARRS